MPADIIFCFRFIIFQVIIFQLRLFPFHRQKFIRKIGIIPLSFFFFDIFDQFSQIFTDMFKFIHTGRLQIIRVQDLIQQFFLCFDLRNIGNTCHRTHLFQKILSRFSIFISHQISKLNPIEQCVKTNGGRLLLNGQRILVTDILIILRIGIIFHIFQMLTHRKIIPAQFLYFSLHTLNQVFAIGNQSFCLIL